MPFRVSRFGYQVSGIRDQVSGIRSRVSSFGYQFSGRRARCRVQGSAEDRVAAEAGAFPEDIAEIAPLQVVHHRRASHLLWALGFGVWGLGFRVWGLGFGVWG